MSNGRPLLLLSPGLPPRTGSIAYINIIMPSVFGTICLPGHCWELHGHLRGGEEVQAALVQRLFDIFIINLSVVDLLFLLGMPFMIHQLMGNGVWHFGETMCTLITAMDANSQFTSTYILTAMAIDATWPVHPSPPPVPEALCGHLVICLPVGPVLHQYHRVCLYAG